MAACANCGKSLGFLGGLTGRRLCKSCSEQAERARTTAEQQYNATLLELISSPAPVADIQSRLPVLAQQAALPEDKRQQLHLETLHDFLEGALKDDHLTVQEEARMNDIAGALGIDQTMFAAEFDDLMPQMIVARVNDGRLPVLPEPQIILKTGELAHISTNAGLLKEVTVREYRGGYSGFSFRVVKGVRYHTGGARGQSVVVGQRIDIEDTGVLTITSQRAVYTGARKTIEMPYTKLVTLNVFDDGVRFHLSNRKNAPLFQVKDGLGHVVAAVVNAAAQQGATVDPSSGDFHLSVVGESHYQDELRRIAAGRTEKRERVEFRVVLIPELDNKYDPQAVAIHADQGGIIGYLSREDAAEYQPAIIAMKESKGHYPACKAVLIGGYEGKPSIGVVLDLDVDALEG